MSQFSNEYQKDRKRDRLLLTLERLLKMEALEVKATLNEVAQLVAEVLEAEKVDVFLYDASIDTLVALGTSNTPLGKRQHASGLNRLPLTNGGYIVKVFLTGAAYLTGHLDQEPERIGDMISVEGLDLRSEMVVALDVNGERRGVLMASSRTPDFFSEQDLSFLEAVSGWIGTVVHKTELSERLREEAVQRNRRMLSEELLTMVAHSLRGYLAPLRIHVDLMQMRAQQQKRSMKDKSLPILMLTACDEVRDKITGLDSGVDDYITRPFDFDELVARICAGLCRVMGTQHATHKLVVDDLVLDTEARQAWRGGDPLELTKREYDLLELLMRNSGHVLTKGCIFERIWGYDSEAGLEVIKVYMNYIRAKLNAGGKPDLIHAVRGVGYVLKP